MHPLYGSANFLIALLNATACTRIAACEMSYLIEADLAQHELERDFIIYYYCCYCDCDCDCYYYYLLLLLMLLL